MINENGMKFKFQYPPVDSDWNCYSFVHTCAAISALLLRQAGPQSQEYSPSGPLQKLADPRSKGRKELTIKPNSFRRFNEKFQANVAGEIVPSYTQTWNWENEGGRSTSLPSHLDSTFKCHQSVCALHDLQGLIINCSARAPDTIQGPHQDSGDVMW